MRSGIRIFTILSQTAAKVAGSLAGWSGRRWLIRQPSKKPSIGTPAASSSPTYVDSSFALKWLVAVILSCPCHISGMALTLSQGFVMSYGIWRSRAENGNSQPIFSGFTKSARLLDLSERQSIGKHTFGTGVQISVSAELLCYPNSCAMLGRKSVGVYKCSISTFQGYHIYDNPPNWRALMADIFACRRT